MIEFSHIMKAFLVNGNLKKVFKRGGIGVLERFFIFTRRHEDHEGLKMVYLCLSSCPSCLRVRFPLLIRHVAV